MGSAVVEESLEQYEANSGDQNQADDCLDV
jgi:hypothetical protein